MRRFMRKIECLAVASLALVGAGRVVVWLTRGVTKALVAWGNWGAAEASSAAPWILFAVVSGLALSLHGLYEDNKRYTKGSPYGRIENSRSRRDESRKVG